MNTGPHLNGQGLAPPERRVPQGQQRPQEHIDDLQGHGNGKRDYRAYVRVIEGHEAQPRLGVLVERDRDHREDHQQRDYQNPQAQQAHHHLNERPGEQGEQAHPEFHLAHEDRLCRNLLPGGHTEHEAHNRVYGALYHA
jgi:hypothetical protein